MRFLVDNALSPKVSRGLNDAGHEATHVRDRGLHAASDADLFDVATQEGRVIVSADADFSTLLAIRATSKPSLILFRHGAERDPHRQVRLLLANLVHLTPALESGCVVTIEPSRVRVRPLPLP